ncbi:hypothetical protein ACBP93_06140 [Paenalcaligenes hominis]|uniref:hypothetical protein n=1 Tax=Paenalcaligenes hominis TaxID=643674 RepID=UPI003523D217
MTMEQRTIIKAPQPRKAPVLPTKFAHLTPFIDWSLPTETERNMRRHEASMEEIHAFIEAMLQDVNGIVEHLELIDPEELPEEEKALMSMLLSLAEVAPVVECYGQQAVVDGYDPRRFQANETFSMHPVL